MCEQLKISAGLKLKENIGVISLGLFPETITLGPEDSRQRTFPTLRFLKDHVFRDSQHIDLNGSTLTIGYNFPFAKRVINYSCDYEWSDNSGWILKTQ